MRRALLWVLAIIILLVALFGGTSQGRTAVKTVLFIPEVVPAITVHPQRWFVPEPNVQKVFFSVVGGQGMADLYRPARGKRHGAVVLFLGVNPAGRDDPRVVGLGKALARAGMVTLIPWSEAMIQKHLDPKDVDLLVAAFQYLQGVEGVDKGRVGMGGFCVGASFALMAAADARIRDQVAFVNAFGPYYDFTDFIVQIASRQRFYGESVTPWQPDPLTREVFTTSLISALADPQERQLLERVFLAGGAATEPELAALSPEGTAVHRLLSGVGQGEARELLGQLPQASRTLLEQLSPSRVVGQVKARVLVMHDREDNLVPSEESRRLVEALNRRGNVYYTDFSFFQHMDPTRPVGPGTFVRELAKFFLHMYNILSVGT